MTWTWTASIDRRESAYDGRPKAYRVRVDLTSDGSASGNLSLASKLDSSEMKEIEGGFCLSLTVIPGTGGTAPDAPFDVNAYDELGIQYIDKTTTSLSSKHVFDTSELIGIPLMVFDTINFDIGDIGTTGDTVQLYFKYIRELQVNETFASVL